MKLENFKRDSILSVGIDIGTSTTQLVFTKIYVSNVATPFSIPKIKISNKEIIYRSDIYFTPLIDNHRINMQEVVSIVDQEYKKAGISPSDLSVGAVIITGETARKDNANDVLHYLSGYAGDFVVATAGPDIESIISAKGAGADKYSKNNCTTTVNIDIGGGTSNLAVFHYGDTVDTSCLDIGGRLVKLGNDRKIIYINEKIKRLIQKNQLDISIGDQANEEKLHKLTKLMVQYLEMSVGLTPKDDFYQEILTNNRHIDSTNIKSICFSGGVAKYIYEPKAHDVFKYNDIGPLLADTIKQSKLFTNLAVVEAEETIRATVIGAGSHTAEISGSTITYSEDVLPLKNIPVLKLLNTELDDLERMGEIIENKLKWYEIDDGFQQVAVAFEGVLSPSFKLIQKYAEQIVHGLDKLIEKKMPLIVITEHDMAKALGQTIQRLINNGSRNRP